ASTAPARSPDLRRLSPRARASLPIRGSFEGSATDILADVTTRGPLVQLTGPARPPYTAAPDSIGQPGAGVDPGREKWPPGTASRPKEPAGAGIGGGPCLW